MLLFTAGWKPAFLVRPLGTLRALTSGLYFRRQEACFPWKVIRGLKGFYEWALSLAVRPLGALRAFTSWVLSLRRAALLFFNDIEMKGTEIVLKGLGSYPDDGVAEDGELALCHNFVNEGDGLRPVETGSEEMALSAADGRVVFVHKAAGKANYIALSGGEGYDLRYRREGGADGWQELRYDRSTAADGSMTGDERATEEMAAVGNTLIVVVKGTKNHDKDGVHYWLWKGDGYTYLGQKPPEAHLQFELYSDEDELIDKDFIFTELGNATVTVPRYKHKTITDLEFIIWSHAFQNWNVSPELYGTVDSTTDYPGEDWPKRSENKLMGVVANAVKEEEEKGRWMYPFMVRYAYELYDGTYIMQSAPVLMMPCDGENPVIGVCCGWNPHGDRYANNSVKEVKHAYVAWTSARLRMRLMGMSDAFKNSLQQWKDIVKGVAIFASEMIYPYNAGGTKISYHGPVYNLGRYGVYSSQYQDYLSDKNTKYQTYRANISRTAFESAVLGKWGFSGVFAGLPEKSTTFEDDIKSVENYYLLHSYPIDDFLKEMQNGWSHPRTMNAWDQGFVDVELPGKKLLDLNTRERLPDDYHSHDTIVPEYVHTYNQRLNMASCTLTPMDVVPAEWLSSCLYIYPHNVPGLSGEAHDTLANIRIFLRENGVEGSVHTEKTSFTDVITMNVVTMPFFFYYPNRTAYKAYVQIEEERGTGTAGMRVFELTMHPHDFLNGCYCYSANLLTEKSVSLTVMDEPNDVRPTYTQLNYLYTSEVGNPFVWPAKGVNMVGTGEIRDIASASEALSQGQFGQFPLYAFCTDGVWALQVGDTGLYSALQPISRDVVWSSKSVTQMAGSVVFVTRQGLMQIRGSQVECLSKALDRRHGLTGPELPHYGELCTVGEMDEKQREAWGWKFRDMLGRARCVYDYVRQRILVYDAGSADAPCYVYSIKSGLWSTADFHIVDGVTVYPVSLMTTEEADGRRMLRKLDEGVTDTVIGKQMFVTRPLKMGDGDVLKTLYTLMVRGNLTDRGHVKTALWGSRDMRRWAYVGSSMDNAIRHIAGSGYKYFIVAGYGKLDYSEMVWRMSVLYGEKETDKLR